MNTTGLGPPHVQRIRSPPAPPHRRHSMALSGDEDDRHSLISRESILNKSDLIREQAEENDDHESYCSRHLETENRNVSQTMMA